VRPRALAVLTRVSADSASGPVKTTPVIDQLFRSSGLCCGPRTIGAILAPTMGDGAIGPSALKQSQGITVVQDPRDAAFPDFVSAYVTSGSYASLRFKRAVAGTCGQGARQSCILASVNSRIAVVPPA
jgi:chemotaxis response regulator CheB